MNPDDITTYRDHLVKSFSCISNNQIIRQSCSNISRFSGIIRDILKGFRNPGNWTLSIDPPWEIPIENDERNFSKDEALLMLSGIMIVHNSRFQIYTFVSSIILKSTNANIAITQIPLEEYCEHKHLYKNRLTRRFHFDLASNEARGNKPVSHLQFGGQEKFSQYAYSLNPKIGIPRIPYPPIDFIILFDMMLRQFKTKIHSNFYDSKDWVNCVKKSECYRLKSYYELVDRYFGSRHRKPLSDKFCSEEFFC